MKPRHTYIIVEGPHDSSVVSRILRKNGLGFQPISLRNAVDSIWDPVIPTTFPQINADNEPEFGRVTVPDFFQTHDQTVAIQFGGGISKLPTVLHDDMDQLSTLPPDAIGLIIDADDGTAANAYATFKTAIQAAAFPFPLPDNHTQFHQGPPRIGVFVIPNNNDPGRLEDTMRECAEVAYPQILEVANSFVSNIESKFEADKNWLPASCRKDYSTDKLRVASIAAVLKPTYAIGNSYRQNKWITEDTLSQPRIAALSAFLTMLLGEDDAVLSANSRETAFPQ